MLPALPNKTYFILIFDFQISNVNSLQMLDIFRYKFYSHVSFAEVLNTGSFIARVFLCGTFFCQSYYPKCGDLWRHPWSGSIIAT